MVDGARQCWRARLCEWRGCARRDCAIKLDLGRGLRPVWANRRHSALDSVSRAKGNIRTFGQCASGRDLRGRGGKKPRCAGQISSARKAGLCRGGAVSPSCKVRSGTVPETVTLRRTSRIKFCDTADCKSALRGEAYLACFAALCATPKAFLRPECFQNRNQGQNIT